ncbi:MAG: hypothetical protein QM785_11960 [Pyrinomonadaceae bacterium]
MPKLYACIISPDIKRDRNSLVGVADAFASSIEVIEDGVLFDVSGLERLVGKPDRISNKIAGELKRRNVEGKVAVADTVDTAKLLARNAVCTTPTVREGENAAMNDSPLLTRGVAQKAVQPDIFQDLPLSGLNIERDTLNVFSELGLRTVKDLNAIPHDDLVGRYGQRFTRVIDVIEQRGRSLITPNIKENKVSWSYELNNPVEDFEQLIFLLNHGLDIVFEEVKYAGFRTEHIDLEFKLRNKTKRSYEIKTSFPTLDRAFWLKLINLRVSLDPPEELIIAVDAVAYFTKPRTDQRGLYAVSRPEPESLLLTVNKLKKLVGQENVGIPKLQNDRLAEPFTLDPEAMPAGKEYTSPSVGKGESLKSNIVEITGWNSEISTLDESPLLTRGPLHARPNIGFTYFRPAIQVEVLVREDRLVYIRSRFFAGHVTNFSGVWKGNSHWWDKTWRTHEWDIEVENHGVYRLCKVDKEWFLSGEYD